MKANTSTNRVTKTAKSGAGLNGNSSDGMSADAEAMINARNAAMSENSPINIMFADQFLYP